MTTPHSQSIDLSYHLEIIQQPVKARATGINSKCDSRRPIDPPPVISLKVIDNNNRDVTHLCLSSFIIRASIEPVSPDELRELKDMKDSLKDFHSQSDFSSIKLNPELSSQTPNSEKINWSSNNSSRNPSTSSAASGYTAYTNDCTPNTTAAPSPVESSSSSDLGQTAKFLTSPKNSSLPTSIKSDSSMLSGTTVASVAHIRNSQGPGKYLFIFSDLSIKLEGVYRLKFQLFEYITSVSPDKSHKIKTESPSSPEAVETTKILPSPTITKTFHRNTVISEPLTVYSAKLFPGLESSSDLIKEIAASGCKVRVRKGSIINRRKLSALSIKSEANSPKSKPNSNKLSIKNIECLKFAINNNLNNDNGPVPSTITTPNNINDKSLFSSPLFHDNFTSMSSQDLKQETSAFGEQSQKSFLQPMAMLNPPSIYPYTSQSQLHPLNMGYTLDSPLTAVPSSAINFTSIPTVDPTTVDSTMLSPKSASAVSLTSAVQLTSLNPLMIQGPNLESTESKLVVSAPSATGNTSNTPQIINSFNKISGYGNIQLLTPSESCFDQNKIYFGQHNNIQKADQLIDNTSFQYLNNNNIVGAAPAEEANNHALVCNFSTPSIVLGKDTAISSPNDFSEEQNIQRNQQQQQQQQQLLFQQQYQLQELLFQQQRQQIQQKIILLQRLQSQQLTQINNAQYENNVKTVPMIVSDNSHNYNLVNPLIQHTPPLQIPQQLPMAEQFRLQSNFLPSTGATAYPQINLDYNFN